MKVRIPALHFEPGIVPEGCSYSPLKSAKVSDRRELYREFEKNKHLSKNIILKGTHNEEKICRKWDGRSGKMRGGEIEEK